MIYMMITSIKSFHKSTTAEGPYYQGNLFPDYVSEHHDKSIIAMSRRLMSSVDLKENMIRLVPTISIIIKMVSIPLVGTYEL